MFTAEDLDQIKTKGLTAEQVNTQLTVLRRGCPRLILDRPATAGDGIVRLSAEREQALLELYGEHCQQGRFSKFVPASGAASRMFRSLLALHEALAAAKEGIKPLEALAQSGDACDHDAFLFFTNLSRFPFYRELVTRAASRGLDLEKFPLSTGYGQVLDVLLAPEGLGYAEIPKGMIPFHGYGDIPKTGFEEHLAEAVAYLADARGKLRVHFTVAQAHEDSVRRHLNRAAEGYEAQGIFPELSFSVQDPSTEAIAADPAGPPARSEDGRLIFYPTGHGALLGNLERFNGDLVFIKNVDNVVPERLRDSVCRTQKILGGLLVHLQKHMFEALASLEEKKPDRAFAGDVLRFIRDELGLWLNPGLQELPLAVQWAEIRNLLSRPIRVCGMVANRGEPGGGPFWVRDKDGSLSLQIVETSQIDMGSPGQKKILAEAAYFNPVMMVAGMKDRYDRSYELSRFCDSQAGFISTKSVRGRSVRVLELPGLWNGGMARWISVFVEIPETAFHPVKTVLDLLKPGHRA